MKTLRYTIILICGALALLSMSSCAQFEKALNRFDLTTADALYIGMDLGARTATTIEEIEAARARNLELRTKSAKEPVSVQP